MDPEAQYKYLLSLKSIRDGASIAYESAKSGKLTNFDFHADKLDEAADFVASLIMRDFLPENFSKIPPHGRWQHFETKAVPRLDGILKEWRAAGVDELECSRRLVDLFLVSVLLDAGAGDVWSYKEDITGLYIERSEGIAVASFYAFAEGLFCSEGTCSVDALGLQSLTTEKLGKAMQSSPENPLLGVQGRAELLQRLGDSLISLPTMFGSNGRPGNVVDYLLQHKSSNKTIDLNILWNSLQQLLIPTWPSGRTVFNGKPLGDAWPLKLLTKNESPSGVAIQPFHKLTQWLTYSLTVIFERVLDIKWTGTEHLTGLPEYRNGGLFVDIGVLTLKPDTLARGLKDSETKEPIFEATDDVIVEWRALTVALLDLMLGLVNEKLSTKTNGVATVLSLPQLLEAGTWKAGRELAAKYRPATKSSPILLQSDGTLF